jgi:hypothetical protein
MMKENEMSVSFFRGSRTFHPISDLGQVKFELKRRKVPHRIFYRGPRKIKRDGQPATSTLKADAVGFVVYLY